jgi:hypothetical protein
MTTSIDEETLQLVQIIDPAADMWFEKRPVRATTKASGSPLAGSSIRIPSFTLTPAHILHPR